MHPIARMKSPRPKQLSEISGMAVALPGHDARPKSPLGVESRGCDEGCRANGRAIGQVECGAAVHILAEASGWLQGRAWGTGLAKGRCG